MMAGKIGIGCLMVVLGGYYTKHKQYVFGCILGVLLGYLQTYHGTSSNETSLVGEVSERIGYQSTVLVTPYNRYYWPRSLQYWGCRVATKGVARMPYRPKNPGGFDQKNWLLNRGINQVWHANEVDVISCHKTIHQRFTYYIDTWLGQYSLQHRPEIEALLSGRSSSKPTYWYQLGIIHLLTISGVHIQLWYQGLRKTLCILHDNTQWLALCLTFMYVALLGYSVPSLRAWLFLLLSYQHHYSGFRRLNDIERFVLSLGIILSLDPHTIYDMGTWMSFIASGVILLSRYFNQSITAPLFFSIAAISSMYHQPTYPVSLLANILVQPIIIGWILPLVGILMVGHVCSLDLAAWALLQLDGVFSCIASAMAILEPCNNLSLLLSKARVFSVLVFLILYYLFQVRFIWGILLWINWPITAISQGHFAIHALNVGHGLAILIQTQSHTLLYDIGSQYQADIAHQAVLPYLYHQGIMALDRVVISHPDKDHMSGLSSLLKAMPVGDMITSIPLLIHQKQQLCQSGTTWEWDGVVFRVLHPNQSQVWEGNNQSCVLHISGTKGSVLLTGDIESRAEKSLAALYPHQLQSTILQVAHHGSSSSSTQDFLQAVNADYYLISEKPNKKLPQWSGVNGVVYPYFYHYL
ncbi:DNA internalization-related competence protein ComEC/Rec2 [Candidatus Synchoanobacter obligatus]|uniref:DNA internalization-related competence protein ComEC/Rec2 n=1 Tax=Candidatus Synchoanobacter obligatus TaxID=2919597 RepID=A0ABT1L4U4_9GAMM|nr:DNA internalization-related competence protein ComEC/Rec2 [Candidatus Synchoanobacter obligatus]MCP8351888.1 DNA internalization-related competence protein ComEC/Rec2 [Candidatus Synchoanobacter obligatus]